MEQTHKSTALILILMAVFAIASFAIAPSIYACSCLTPPPPREMLTQATAVFAGTVIDNSYSNGAVFEVEKAWKGISDTKRISVAQGYEAACGKYFEKDKRYLVYGFFEDGKLQTSICSRTRELVRDDDPELAELGAWNVPPGYGDSSFFDSLYSPDTLRLLISFLGGAVLGVVASMLAARTFKKKY